MHLRATPQTYLPSPADMLFGRQVKTTLPGRHIRHQRNDVHDYLQQRREKMRADHDRHAGQELPQLSVGQKVRTLNPDDYTWFPAQVSRICEEPRSYEVTTPNGSTLRSNRSHLKEIYASDRTKHNESSNATTPMPRRMQFENEEEIAEDTQVMLTPTHRKQGGGVQRTPTHSHTL